MFTPARPSRPSHRAGAAGSALLLLAAACSSDGTAPATPSLTAAQAGAFALSVDQLAGDQAGDEAATQDAASASVAPARGAALAALAPLAVTFDRTQSCPAGGSTALHGQAVRARTGTTFTATMTATWTATRCATPVDAGTFTVDGTLAMQASRQRVAGLPSGPQTTKVAGSLSWTRAGGETGSCAFDLSSVRTPAAAGGTGTRTVTGTACGRAVEQTTSWTRGA